MKIAALISHPVQYYAPIFRELAGGCHLHVFFGQKLTADQQGEAGFGKAFDWDIDLLSGYSHSFLANKSRKPGPDHFFGCDTPEIASCLREGAFDALVVAGWYLKSHIQAVIAAKRQGLPVLVRGDSHLETPRSVLKRHLKEIVNPTFLRLFDGALYVGEKSRAFYAHYRYPAHRLFHSPHCVDNDWFATRSTMKARAALRASCGVDDGAFVILFAGKLMSLKRPLDVVAAAARVRASGRNVEVMVAGSGALEDDMRQKAMELAVPLHMLGFRNQTQMPPTYAAADALVLPGEETWGLVANEALACSRPVIISNACGAAPDLAADCKAGRVTPLGDVEAIAAAVNSIIAQPPTVADIRARSDSFSIARAVDGILKAAESVRSKTRSSYDASHAA